MGDQVIYKTRAGRQIVAMLVASSKMGMTPMDVFNEVLVEDHDILAFLKEYSVTEDVGHSVSTWSRIQGIREKGRYRIHHLVGFMGLFSQLETIILCFTVSDIFWC